MKESIAILALTMSVRALHAATIGWSAVPLDGYGFDSASGIDLQVGSLVRIGTFDIADSEIQANATNIAFLDANFTEAGWVTIGTGVENNPGFFTTDSNYNATATGLAGKQVYFWVFASTDNSSPLMSINTAVEIGIFYEPLANNSNWAFAGDIPSPGASSVAIRDLVDPEDLVRPEAKIIVGSYGPGTSDITGKPSFTLLAIPEPGSAMLALAGGCGFLMRRRHRRK